MVSATTLQLLQFLAVVPITFDSTEFPDLGGRLGKLTFQVRSHRDVGEGAYRLGCGRGWGYSNALGIDGEDERR